MNNGTYQEISTAIDKANAVPARPTLVERVVDQYLDSMQSSGMLVPGGKDSLKAWLKGIGQDKNQGAALREIHRRLESPSGSGLLNPEAPPDPRHPLKRVLSRFAIHGHSVERLFEEHATRLSNIPDGEAAAAVAAILELPSSRQHLVSDPGASYNEQVVRAVLDKIIAVLPACSLDRVASAFAHVAGSRSSERAIAECIIQALGSPGKAMSLGLAEPVSVGHALGYIGREKLGLDSGSSISPGHRQAVSQGIGLPAHGPTLSPTGHVDPSTNML